MTECYFVERLSELFMELDHDWDWGNELNGEVVSIIKLCEQFLKEKRESDEDGLLRSGDNQSTG